MNEITSRHPGIHQIPQKRRNRVLNLAAETLSQTLSMLWNVTRDLPQLYHEEELGMKGLNLPLRSRVKLPVSVAEGAIRTTGYVGRGTGTTGTTLWPSSQVLAAYLVSLSTEERKKRLVGRKTLPHASITSIKDGNQKSMMRSFPGHHKQGNRNLVESFNSTRTDVDRIVAPTDENSMTIDANGDPNVNFLEGCIIYESSEKIMVNVKSSGTTQKMIGDRPLVIELGAGTGYLSLVLSSLNYEVISTDHPSVLSLLQSNIHRNLPILSRAGYDPHIVIHPLDWEEVKRSGRLPKQLLDKRERERPTLVVMSDTVYSTDLIIPLLETIRLICLSPELPEVSLFERFPSEDAINEKQSLIDEELNISQERSFIHQELHMREMKHSASNDERQRNRDVTGKFEKMKLKKGPTVIIALERRDPMLVDSFLRQAKEIGLELRKVGRRKMIRALRLWGIGEGLKDEKKGIKKDEIQMGANGLWGENENFGNKRNKMKAKPVSDGRWHGDSDDGKEKRDTERGKDRSERMDKSFGDMDQEKEEEDEEEGTEWDDVEIYTGRWR
ncbi:hypothetical protein TREMEDRAFT_63306 [Tremella mesenterica DSM 1558]|uniref:uncharacterized protein n=1 Tax=Tremella mesenterica (strain ATCC 24925 / CBS 8224 / DSM 1558 / NBRC 9311 / NRRL Y-6157 / RJB 2259-6 / UBC 559-6) TaxID=578456 RepID=UPI0003F48C36|nr:uncharacterized protein TREMEDRAFT_63306 [Tremella mesenterica DSM 1558]EIW68839.1 hypothetical protein TREMEDRAFT_63306 [Tremella mesenterica DSM 1558]